MWWFLGFGDGNVVATLCASCELKEEEAQAVEEKLKTGRQMRRQAHTFGFGDALACWRREGNRSMDAAKPRRWLISYRYLLADRRRGSTSAS